MGEGNWRYAVLVCPAHWQPERVNQALRALPEPPGGGSASAVSASWGMFQGFSEARAKGVAAALNAGGVDAIAAPENLLEELPAAEPVKELDLSALPALRLAAAASYVEVTRRPVAPPPSVGALLMKVLRVGLLAAGVPVPASPAPKEKLLEEREPAYVLDLVLDKPARRLRVDFRHFDFSCLGSEKGLDSVGNFARLVSAVSSRCSGRLNRGAESIAAGGPPRAHGYGALGDLEREERWLLSWRALRPAG